MKSFHTQTFHSHGEITLPFFFFNIYLPAVFASPTSRILGGRLCRAREERRTRGRRKSSLLSPRRRPCRRALTRVSLFQIENPGNARRARDGASVFFFPCKVSCCSVIVNALMCVRLICCSRFVNELSRRRTGAVRRFSLISLIRQCQRRVLI